MYVCMYVCMYIYVYVERWERLQQGRFPLPSAALRPEPETRGGGDGLDDCAADGAHCQPASQPASQRTNRSASSIRARDGTQPEPGGWAKTLPPLPSSRTRIRPDRIGPRPPPPSLSIACGDRNDRRVATPSRCGALSYVLAAKSIGAGKIHVAIYFIFFAPFLFPPALHAAPGPMHESPAGRWGCVTQNGVRM